MTTEERAAKIAAKIVALGDENASVFEQMLDRLKNLRDLPSEDVEKEVLDEAKTRFDERAMHIQRQLLDEARSVIDERTVAEMYPKQ